MDDNKKWQPVLSYYPQETRKAIIDNALQNVKERQRYLALAMLEKGETHIFMPKQLVITVAKETLKAWEEFFKE